MLLPLFRFKLRWMAPTDYEKCYLNISLLDDSNKSMPVSIEEMDCNGVFIESEDKNEYGPFAISTNEKVILNVKTNINDYFACEVKVICK